MRRFSVLALAVLSTATFSTSSTAAPAAVSTSAKPVAGTSCSAFPGDNWWHADVSVLPVHARSGQWLSHMSTGADLHPDFGPSYGDGPNYGIPITVVDHSHPRVSVGFDYDNTSARPPGAFMTALSAVLPGVDYDEGMRFANRIDRTGQAIVWSGHQELAELAERLDLVAARWRRVNWASTTTTPCCRRTSSIRCSIRSRKIPASRRWSGEWGSRTEPRRI